MLTDRNPAQLTRPESDLLARTKRASDGVSGCLLLLTIYSESSAAVQRLNQLLFLKLVERCEHPTITTDGGKGAPAVRITDAGRVAL